MSVCNVEDITLRHSARGMEVLRPYLPADFCRRAARALLALPRGKVLLSTGFYVKGFAETDGPPGTYFLANALEALGFRPVVVTDGFAEGLFDGMETLALPPETAEDACTALLDRFRPVALIAVERCGVNARGEYANMRGVSIAAHTAALDPLFDEGRRRGIPTFGIGDGGNEIGMGCFREVIARELALVPCVTEVDFPIIATVSNWGAYGLCACLTEESGRPLLPSDEEVRAYLAFLADKGCVDGVTGQHTPTEDGFPPEVTDEILTALRDVL